MNSLFSRSERRRWIACALVLLGAGGAFLGPLHALAALLGAIAVTVVSWILSSVLTDD